VRTQEQIDKMKSWLCAQMMFREKYPEYCL